MTKKRPAAEEIGCDARALWLAKHSALSYANQWFSTDREFMRQLKLQDSGEISPDVLKKLAAKYMVARGFKKSNSTRASDSLWTQATACLARFSVSGGPICDEVLALAKSLGKVAPVGGKNRNLISAATKFLWFAGNHDVRIFDKRAVAALSRLKGARVLTGEYSNFAHVWREQFDLHKSEIEGAVAELADRLEWTCIDPVFYEETREVLTKPWFIDRVFDKYLWTIGSAEGSAATSFV